MVSNLDLKGFELLKPFGAEIAGRTGAAAIAPFMPMRTVSFITSDAFLHDQIDKGIAAQIFRQLPCLGLVDEHQWRMDLNFLRQTQRKRLSGGRHGLVSAIGI